jgi:hypothetical protein
MRVTLIVAGALGTLVVAGAACESSSASGDHAAAVDGGLVSDAGTAAACGASPCAPGLVCDRYGAPACVDPNWAAWPMPNAQVDVEAGATSPDSYTDNGDGTVTDNVTQLMWQQLTPTTSYTQPEALAYCADLTLGGHTDWRLPSVVELISIVDTDTYNPSIDATFFPGTSAVGFYWSVTLYPGAPANAWGVYFNNGYNAYNPMSMAYSVRCVR